MQFIKPPRHRVDAPIVFVHPADGSWDKEAVAKAEEDHGSESPFLVYQSGRTRFDLGARGEHGSAQDLLSGKPVEYHLRRLSVLELNEVQGLLEREVSQGYPLPRSAYLQAARYGLSAVKSDGNELLELERPGNLTRADVETLAECTELGGDLLMHIGQASYAASRPLRDDEKKL